MQKTDSAVIDFLKAHHEPKVVEVGEGAQKTAVLVLPSGMAAKPITDFTDKLLEKPRRKTGTFAIETLESFCAFVASHKEASSTVFVAPKTGGMTAVLNFHETGATGQRFGDLRVTYEPVKAEQWNTWTGKSGALQELPDFAEFVDTNILDISEPPPRDSQDPLDQGLLDLAKAYSTTIAEKAKVIELSRGLRVHVKDEVETALDPASGEMTMNFKSEHTGRDGNKLEVPGLFCITIPVFDRGAVYRLPCRLKYRALGGRVGFIYQIVNQEKAREHAVNQMVDKVKTETALPVVFGAAPRS